MAYKNGTKKMVITICKSEPLKTVKYYAPDEVIGAQDYFPCNDKHSCTIEWFEKINGIWIKFSEIKWKGNWDRLGDYSEKFIEKYQ